MCSYLLQYTTIVFFISLELFFELFLTHFCWFLYFTLSLFTIRKYIFCHFLKVILELINEELQLFHILMCRLHQCPLSRSIIIYEIIAICKLAFLLLRLPRFLTDNVDIWHSLSINVLPHRQLWNSPILWYRIQKGIFGIKRKRYDTTWRNLLSKYWWWIRVCWTLKWP